MQLHHQGFAISKIILYQQQSTATQKRETLLTSRRQLQHSTGSNKAHGWSTIINSLIASLWNGSHLSVASNLWTGNHQIWAHGCVEKKRTQGSKSRPWRGSCKSAQVLVLFYFLFYLRTVSSRCTHTHTPVWPEWSVWSKNLWATPVSDGAGTQSASLNRNALRCSLNHPG